jgi:hypothetical protein
MFAMKGRCAVRIVENMRINQTIHLREFQGYTLAWNFESSNVLHLKFKSMIQCNPGAGVLQTGPIKFEAWES